MSSVEQMLHDCLVNDATFNGIIGGRLRLGQLRLGETLPAASYLKIGTPQRWTTLDQTTGKWQKGGVARFWITLAFQSKTGGQDSIAAAASVQAALLTLNATRTPPTVAAGTSAPNLLVNEFMRINAKVDPPIFETVLDYKIIFQES